MTENQKLREALELCRAALDNPGLAATLRKYAIRTADEALATTEPEPFDERAAFVSEMMRRKSWTVYEFQPHPHRGEYPHPDYLAPHANTAWAGWQARAAMAQVSDINVAESFTNDTKDAERYRWLADSNNYYEAINLISDGSLTEDALGKAIDAAMARGVKG